VRPDLFAVSDDLFNKFPDLNKLYYMFTLATHPDYRGCGIASELVEQSKKVRRVGSTIAPFSKPHDPL